MKVFVLWGGWDLRDSEMLGIFYKEEDAKKYGEETIEKEQVKLKATWPNLTHNYKIEIYPEIIQGTPAEVIRFERKEEKENNQ